MHGPVGSTNAGKVVVGLSIVGDVLGAVDVGSGGVSVVDVKIRTSPVTVETETVSVVMRGVVVVMG